MSLKTPKKIWRLYIKKYCFTTYVCLIKIRWKNSLISILNLQMMGQWTYMLINCLLRRSSISRILKIIRNLNRWQRILWCLELFWKFCLKFTIYWTSLLLISKYLKRIWNLITINSKWRKFMLKIDSWTKRRFLSIIFIKNSRKIGYKSRSLSN